MGTPPPGLARPTSAPANLDDIESLFSALNYKSFLLDDTKAAEQPHTRTKQRRRDECRVNKRTVRRRRRCAELQRLALALHGAHVPWRARAAPAVHALPRGGLARPRDFQRE